MSRVFIVVQGKANVILFETTLYEKARLARSFPNVLRAPGAKSLLPYGERPLAPAVLARIDELRCQIVADAPLSQLITDFQRTQPTRGTLNHKTLGESSVGQEILRLQRIQHFIDERLRKASPSELAAELGARVLAACE